MKRAEFLKPINEFKKAWNDYKEFKNPGLTELEYFEMILEENLNICKTWANSNFWSYTCKKNPNRLTQSQEFNELNPFLGLAYNPVHNFQAINKLKELKKRIRDLKKAQNG